MSVLCALLLSCTFTCVVILCSIYRAVMVGVMCGGGRLRKCFCSALTSSLSELSDTHIHTHTHSQHSVTDCDCPPGAYEVGLPSRLSIPFFSSTSLNFLLPPILHFPNFISNLSTGFFSTLRLNLSSSLSPTITSSQLPPLAELQPRRDLHTIRWQPSLCSSGLCDGT